MRMFVPILLALTLAGCAPDAPTFTGPRQELAYLEDQANPTPEQWKRRDELRAMKAAQRGAFTPAAGDVVTLPVMADVYETVPGMQALDGDRRVGILLPGARVRVAEVDPAWVRIEAITGGALGDPPTLLDGTPGRVAGFVPRWWDDPAD